MQNFNIIDLIVVLVYLLSMAALGIYQTVKIKSSGDYFAGGRKFNKWLMMMHTLGTGTHADDPVGVTGAAFEKGISGIWYTFMYLFVTPFYWVIAPLFRRSRFITTADFFKARFSQNMALMYTLVALTNFTISTGMMLKATGTICTAVTQGQVPEWMAVAGMTVVFVSYGLAGGLVATVITESVQGVLIIVMSLLLVPFGLIKIGGFAAMHRLLTPDKFSLHATMELSIPWIMAASLMSVIAIVAIPTTMEICATGKTEFEGRIGFVYGHYIKRLCAMGWAFTGLVVAAMVAVMVASGTLPPLARREEAFGVAIRMLLRPGFTGLMFAAILAAQMSTLSAVMVASSALIARNIYKERFNSNVSDEKLLSMARWSGLIIVALGVAFSFVLTGVAEAITIAVAVTTLAGLLIWFGVLWRRTSSVGAWVSFAVMTSLWLVLGPMGAKLRPLIAPSATWLGLYGDKAVLHRLVVSYLPAGVLALIIGSLASDREKSKLPAIAWTAAVAILWEIAVPMGKGAALHMDPFQVALTMYACLGSSVLALVCGFAFSLQTDHKKLDHFYLLLKTPVGREEELKKAGVDVIYAGHSEGHPWELKHPKLLNIGGFLTALVIALIILLIVFVLARIGA